MTGMPHHVRTCALVLLALPPREAEVLPEDIEVRPVLLRRLLLAPLVLAPLREPQQRPVLRLA